MPFHEVDIVDARSANPGHATSCQGATFCLDALLRQVFVQFGVTVSLYEPEEETGERCYTTCGVKKGEGDNLVNTEAESTGVELGKKLGVEWVVVVVVVSGVGGLGEVPFKKIKLEHGRKTHQKKTFV